MVQTDYIGKRNLASYVVNTPDPELLNPPIGQRLVINWLLPPNTACNDLQLKIFIRFRNKELLEKDLNINCSNGTYTYFVMNEDFLRTDGILSYKVLLIANGECISEFRHQLWADVIVFDQED